MALSDPTRRQVINLLRQGPRPAGELAGALKMSPPAMSRHLRLLRQTELVEEKGADHDARLRVYRLRKEPFDELQAWIQEIETFWADQLSAFKNHVERGRRGKDK